MKFAEFVITETVGNSVDPLGYLKPSGEVFSGLFRPFTVSYVCQVVQICVMGKG
jgi:hypothetical protein